MFATYCSTHLFPQSDYKAAYSKFQDKTKYTPPYRMWLKDDSIHFSDPGQIAGSATPDIETETIKFVLSGEDDSEILSSVVMSCRRKRL